MPIDPIPSPDAVKRIKQYYPRAYPKWNRRYNRWDIVDKHMDGFDIILMAVRNDDGSYRPLDNRTYSQLRFMRWFNNKPHRMKRMLWDMVQDDQAKEIKAQKDQKNTIRDMAQEIAPLLRQMARDSGFSAYSKPVPYGRGIGTGTLNQQLGRKFIATVGGKTHSCVSTTLPLKESQ